MFLRRPGVSGPVGALMDEYARAAEDVCSIVEHVPAARFAAEVESPDPDTVSIRAICRHLVRAAYGYSVYIRTVRGLATDGVADPTSLATPADLRPMLAAALQHTEVALAGLEGADQAALDRLQFKVRWGPTYDPEMIVEHAIVHLLRHRRQILRWPS